MAISAGVSSAATTIGFNFTETWGAKQVEGDTVYGSDQWTDSVSHSATNGTVAANSTDPDAVTTTTATGVTVAWTSSNMYQAGDENNIVENKLFRRYLDDGDAGPTITVTGLAAWLASESATGYTITFFQNSDTTANNFAQMDLFDGTGTGGSLLESMAPEVSDGSGAGSGSRLVRTTTNAFTNDTITFHTDRDLGGGNRASVSGFLITAVPEPSSAALLGLAGLALILRRRV